MSTLSLLQANNNNSRSRVLIDFNLYHNRQQKSTHDNFPSSCVVANTLPVPVMSSFQESRLSQRSYPFGSDYGTSDALHFPTVPHPSVSPACSFPEIGIRPWRSRISTPAEATYPSTLSFPSSTLIPSSVNP